MEDLSMFTEERIKELDEEYAGYIETASHQTKEGTHLQMDEYLISLLLVSLLVDLGFEKVVEEFKSIPKKNV